MILQTKIMLKAINMDQIKTAGGTELQGQLHRVVVLLGGPIFTV